METFVKHLLTVITIVVGAMKEDRSYSGKRGAKGLRKGLLEEVMFQLRPN